MRGDDGFTQAATVASAAYRDAHGNHAARLAMALEAHLAALATAGLLTELPPGITGPPTIEDDARWLAAAGGHPRHSGEHGWQRLLESEADIRMACRHATSDLTAGQGVSRDQVTARRDRLLTHLAVKTGDSEHVQ